MKSLISLRKRGLALFLVLSMCLSLLQVTAFAENSAAESTEPAAADNLNPDDGQAGENPPVCICTDKCGETPNTDCLVCAENPAACVGQEPAPVCNCETKCGDVPNALCPVCSAVGVDSCKGVEPAPVCICTDKCGETPNMDCLVCAENLAACVGQEPVPVCNCETKCGDVPNALCPVCSAVGADQAVCMGLEPAPVVPALVQAFLDAVAALPALEAIPAEATEAEIETLHTLVDACQDAYDALSGENMEREDVNAAIVTLNAVSEKFAAIQVLEENGEDHFRVGDKSYVSLQDAIDAAGNGGTVVVTHNVIEKGGLTISQPVTIQLDADLTLTGLGSGKGVSLTSSLSLTGSGTMSVNQFGYGFSLNSTSSITINKGTTLECSNNGYGMCFWGGTSTITVYGTLRCDKNTTNGIYIEYDKEHNTCAKVTMPVDGGYVSFCDNGWNGMKGSHAKSNLNVDGYETVVTLFNGAEFYANNNITHGVDFVNFVMENGTTLTADNNAYGLSDVNINSHGGTVRAKANNNYGWRLGNGTSTIDKASHVLVTENGSKAKYNVENCNPQNPIYPTVYGAIVTGGDSTLLVNEGADFRVIGNYGNGIRLEIEDSKLVMESGIIQGNGFDPDKRAPEGGGIYNNMGIVKLGKDVVISENYASNFGGGIYNSKTVELGKGVVISGNHAGSYGGGIYNYGNVSCDGAVISDNHAPYGGGICNTANGVIALMGAAITLNQAATYGGGIYNTGKLNCPASVIVGSGTSIQNNSAPGGGGIANYSKVANAYVSLEPGANLYNNHAASRGDDLYNLVGKIDLCGVGSDWKLDGKPDHSDHCTHPITGWFYDGYKDGKSVERWNVIVGENTCNTGRSNHYVDECTAKEISANYVGLKAAHPDMAAYQVIHTYFVNDVEATEERTTDAIVYLPVGQEILGDSILRNTQDGRYTYTSGADDFKLTADNVETPRIITLRYDRTVATTGRYTVIHQYYTNGALDGSTTSTPSAGIGEVIRAADIIRVPTYGGNTYTYTSAAGGGFAIVAEVNSGAITLRYDRVSYRVVHEYYTNGALDGSTNEAVRYVNRGTTVDVTAIQRQTGYAGAAYTYTSVSPNANSVTVADDGSTVITLRYNRTASPGNPGTPVTPVNPVTPVTPVTPNIPDTPTPAGPSPVAPGTNISDEDVPLGLVGLNTIDHIAYIIGYEDGTVRPDGKITRAEVATIFFRLMTDEFRTANWSTENDFPDVAASNWFNNAVSTNSKAGIVKGYMDGTFKANRNITRAEFAAIAARFLSDEDAGPGGRFSDISGHWAEEEINRAVAQGWIKGYEDGTFRPDQDITRAEAVTLINRMLDRMPDKDHLLEDMIRWPDNTEDKWYYEDMQEATNSHDYDRDEMGIMEVWTEKLEERSWKEFEYEWATAASAPGREVADNLYGNTPEGESEGEEETAPETTGDGEN